MKTRNRCGLRVEALDQRDAPSVTGFVSVSGGHGPPGTVHHFKINAKGEGQITSFNRATGQVTTSGTIDDGVLRGTTEFRAQIIDSAGDYVGATTIVTKHGDVTLSNVGTLNPNGAFTDHATVTGGTGRFAGATGSLVFQGHELADGVHFLDDSITGTIDVTRHHPAGD
jgi:hypothetical protein